MSAVETEFSSYLDGFGMEMADLQKRFRTDGYIEIPEFGPAGLKADIISEVYALLEEHGQRRQLKIASTGNSPRYYEAVGRNAIVANSEAIPASYRSPALLRFLAELTQEEGIVPVPWEPEEIVITRMTQTGDSHGWHWDDYSYSLIWIVEAPGEDEGGALEYVRDTEWDKQNPRIEEYLREGTVERRQPAKGSVYLLKADTAMHRVAPLTKEGARRVILCYSYATLADLDRDVTHETMEELYPEDHASV
ncbi:ArpA protein [Streptomyces sp. PRKS01-65]|nr:ArpA protein [Streptomyces harenosi]NEY30951.1 ArpA protein [Streptomyces harenosi]